MAEYTEIQLTKRSRWETVAYEAYGDVSRMNEIIEANPQVRADAVLDVGTVLRIPIISEAVIEADLLPPWKQ
jgi:prophage DNA circulation protein